MAYDKLGTPLQNAPPHDGIDPEHYHELAGWCEKLAPSDQAIGFDRVLREFGASQTIAVSDQLVAGLAEAGAFESAALALIPKSAIFTGGRLQDGSFVAQVIPEGGTGAHSRNARSLAMAWLAALLRAMARQSVEDKVANAN